MYDEDDTRKRLEALLKKFQESPTYTETKFTNGDGFVEYHMKWIRRVSGDRWNSDLAKQRLQLIEFPPDMQPTGH